WIAGPLITCVRLARSRTLMMESPDPPHNAPTVSLIIPARNEAHNIARCVTSFLTSTYPSLNITVVNDHSTDATAEIVRAIAQRDPRVHVIDNPDLPDGWFGKQWACQNGANHTTGEILIF